VKAEANDALREGDVELAAALYDEAIERLRERETNPPETNERFRHRRDAGLVSTT
jgi:hypothetical protein